MFIRDCPNPKCRVAFSVKHKSSKQKFCSRSCATTVTNSLRKGPQMPEAPRNKQATLFVVPEAPPAPMLTLTCSYCKSTFKRRRREKFCTHLCRKFWQASTLPMNLDHLPTFQEVQETLVEVISEAVMPRTSDGVA